MPPIIKRVSGAMFDVRPPKEDGSFEGANLDALLTSVNLRPEQKKSVSRKIAISGVNGSLHEIEAKTSGFNVSVDSDRKEEDRKINLLPEDAPLVILTANSDKSTTVILADAPAVTNINPPLTPVSSEQEAKFNNQIKPENTKDIKNEVLKSIEKSFENEDIDKTLEEAGVRVIASGVGTISRQRLRPISGQMTYATLVADVPSEDVPVENVISAINDKPSDNSPDADSLLKQMSHNLPPEWQPGYEDSDKILQELQQKTRQFRPQDGQLSVHLDKNIKSARLQMWLHDAKDRIKHDLSSIKRVRVDDLPKKTSFLKTAAFKNATLAMFLVMMIFGGGYGLTLKSRIIEESNSGAASLQEAQYNLEEFKFEAASQNFLSAYEEFTRASGDINVLGATISNLLAELPGASKLKSAKNLIEVGRLVADTGKAMSGVISALSRSGVALNPQSNSRVLVSEVIEPLRKALSLADDNLKKADYLMASIDSQAIPEEKREKFEEFKTKLPKFQTLVSQGSEYTEFFEGLVAMRGTKKYLLLFENNSELRPTGGFPGTYGVVTFQDGQLKEFITDDVYNLDGQLKDLYVPPKELQHITPNWGMRDANWFADFPTSAKKVMQFFRKGAGYDVDGVITLNPSVMQSILRIIGPIEMKEYNLTVNADNFLPTIQSEVEYGPNKEKNQPKKIVTDMAPIVLNKMYSADKTKWLSIFSVFMDAMDEKDIKMYFKDTDLQSFVLKKNFAGEVKDVKDDFLMVTFSNIKGSKADAVTENAVKLMTTVNRDVINNRLIITRRHNGGNSKYGFYNRQNSSYIRVLVPKGARLLGVSGNSEVAYAPLLNYPKTDFLRDEDLLKYESSAKVGPDGALVYEESGKTEFGFWMLINPGEIKTVELEYEIPLAGEIAPKEYSLYVQKQPGAEIKDFQFNIRKTDDFNPSNSTVPFRVTEDGFTYQASLDKDTQITVISAE